MKKLLLSFCLLALVGITMNAFGQGVNKVETINSTRNYSVTANASNTFAWAVLDWNGTDDYTTDTWTATATAATNYTKTDTDNTTEIKWLTGGNYVVQVTETQNGCTTIRRYGVKVLDLDLLVVTKNHLGTAITAAGTYCNTDEGNIYGNDDADNLNATTGVTPALGTMEMTYEVSLYTVKGSSTSTDLIASALSTAAWKFELDNTSTIPATPGDVTWSVTGGTAASSTFADDGDGVINVAAGTSTVTIKAVIQNIAAVAANTYALNFAIDPASVLIENGGTSTTDYAEGQEPSTYTGADSSHVNRAVQITVKPIPNTSKITAN